MPTFRQDVLWYGSVGLVDEFNFICLRLDRMYYGMALLVWLMSLFSYAYV